MPRIKYMFLGKFAVNLPIQIHDMIKPIFEQLSDENLLRKCLHGETQNVNEGINNIIWSKCPKNIYVSRKVLQIGVNSAVLAFNEGALSVEMVLKYFNIETGEKTQIASHKKDKARVHNMTKKEQEYTKKKKKTLKRNKKRLFRQGRET